MLCIRQLDLPESLISKLRCLQPVMKEHISVQQSTSAEWFAVFLSQGGLVVLLLF